MIISNRRLLGCSDKAKACEKLYIPTRKPDELSRKAQIHSNIFSLTSQNKVDVTSKPDKLANRWNRDSKELSSKPIIREAHVNPKQLHSKSFAKKSGPFRQEFSPEVQNIFPSQKPNNQLEDMTRKNVVMEQKIILLKNYSKTSDNNINHTYKVARHVDDKSIPYFQKPSHKFETRIPKESSVKVPQNLIPVVNQHTSTSSNVAFGPNVASILSKQYHNQKVSTFTWVKHRIPSPPPNLEQVERKLYPHRFKLIVEDVSTFYRIPTPPPHMPEAINRPLLELIPSPPPDIPKYLLGGVFPKTFALKTDRVPNPILSIIPAPPPDMPSETPPQAIPQTQHVKLPVSSTIPSPPPDLPNGISVPSPPPDLPRGISVPSPPPDLPRGISVPSPPPDLPRGISVPSPPPDLPRGISVPSPPPDLPRGISVPSPPPDLPKGISVPSPPPDLPREISIPFPPTDLPKELLITPLNLPTQTSKIPSPPPDLPNQFEINSAKFLDRFDSSGSWDSFVDDSPIIALPGVSTRDFHDLHLKEIVQAANLREKEMISKSRKAAKNVNQAGNLRNLHLKEIVQAANLREKEMISKSRKAAKNVNQAGNLRDLHLKEIVQAANLREKEMISKSRKAAKNVNQAGNLRDLHLKEIVQAANLREKEMISKSRKAAKNVNQAGNLRDLHLKEIVQAANLREKEMISKSRKAAKNVNQAGNLRDLHLKEIVQAANLREKEMISKSRKAAKNVNQAGNLRDLHLKEIVQAANLREKEMISKSRKAAKNVNQAGNLRDLHLKEIVQAANLREKEMISKSQTVSSSRNQNPNAEEFRKLHLREIAQAANLKRVTSNNIQVDNLYFHESHLQEIRNVAREKQRERLEEEERVSRLETTMKVSNPNVSDNGFHELHLQEIVKAANLRKNEQFKKKKIVSQIKQTQGTLPNTSTTRLCISLPSLKKKPYFTDLIKQLGLFHFRDDFFLNEESSKFTVDEKLSLLIEVENNLVMGKPIDGILPHSMRENCSSSYPDLKSHFNLMSRHLTPPIYHRLSQVKTASGFTIDQAIQTGIDNPGDPFNLTIGCVAGDEDSYTTFSELFDKVIYSANNGYAIDQVHCSDFDPITITDGYFDPNYVLSCHVMAARSIKGFSLLPHCTTNERRTVEAIVKECVTNMPHPYKGRYLSLSSITPEDQGYLTSRNFLFSKPVSPLVVSAKIVRGWPDARGLWLNRDENFMAWVNTEDHVKLISMEEGGDFRNVFERFCLGVQLFEMTITLRGYALMKSEHLGYIVTCPSNLGTAITLTVTMMTQKLLSYHGLEIILEFLLLEKKKVINAETGEFQVCNLVKIGHTEVEIAQKFIHGVHLLIRIEKTLWSGLSLQEFLQQVNPELADLLLVGVYPKELSKRIKIPKSIPPPPPDIPHELPRVWW